MAEKPKEEKKDEAAEGAAEGGEPKKKLAGKTLSRLIGLREKS